MTYPIRPSATVDAEHLKTELPDNPPKQPAPPAGAAKTSPLAPASSPRAILLAIAMVAGLAELAYAVMNISAMPVYLKFSMHYGATVIASIGTAFLFCEGLMKGPFGVLGDRIGRKRLMIAGPLLSVFTALLTLLVHPHQWYFFVLLRVLDGLGAAALWPAALAMIADVVSEDRRSQAMSLFNVTYLIGVALGPVIGGAANDLTRTLFPGAGEKVAYQTSFYVISFLFLLTALIAYWRIPNIRPHHEHHDSELEAGFSFKALAISLKKIPEMLAMAFVTFFGIGMIMLIIKLFALDEFHVTETGFGALLILPCLIIAAASVPLGTIGDKIGKARTIRLGIGICALSMWALILIRNEVALIIGGSAIGIGFVMAFPAWMAHISATCDPRQRGAVMGAVGTAQGVGAMLGAPLGGYLYEHANIHLPFIQTDHPSHYIPFIGCALMLLVSWIIAATTIKETPKLEC
jgi:DHA1 family multidrug resistance protein-like MFS transporter